MQVVEEYSARLMHPANVAAASYRAEIVLSTVKRLLPDSKSRRVLDVGCGTGIVLQRLRQEGYENLYGADALRECVERLQEAGFPSFLIDLNAAEPGLPDSEFDVILLLEVLEHLYDPGTALRCLRDRLDNDGLLIASVPNEYRLRKRISVLFGAEMADPMLVGGHIKFFSFHSFRRLIEEQGFTILEHFGAGGVTLHNFPFGRMLLRKRPDLFSKWSFVVARPSRSAR
jgi:2-polyprenyl-3-methyl-5-hydroxy-6-metoxy-1,4-benzoquinol methylase